MPRLALPEGLGDAFSVRDARLLGIGEGRLRGRDLSRPFHGARAAITAADGALTPWEREEVDVRRRIAAYATVMPSRAMFAGPTAALLHGLPLPPGCHRELHVAVMHPSTAPHRDGIRGIQVRPRMAVRTVVDGFAVTDVATTWAMLGRTLDTYDLVAVADAIICRPRHPGTSRRPAPALAERAELQAALVAGRRRGADGLREALTRTREGAASRPETHIRLILEDAGLPEPVLDYDVHRADGCFLGCSELAYPRLRVAVEYESDGHLTRRQLERDIEKYTDYQAAGWTTVRLTSAHVFRAPSEVVRRVSDALRRAGR